jgi:hypothetical protein
VPGWYVVIQRAAPAGHRPMVIELSGEAEDTPAA